MLYDRAFALVGSSSSNDGDIDSKNSSNSVIKRVLTQKTHPRLALVQPSIDLTTNIMTVSAPDFDEILVISLIEKEENNKEERVDDDEKEFDFTRRPTNSCCYDVNVCGNIRHGSRISRDADQWFSRYLSILPSSSSSVMAAVRKPMLCSLLRSINATTALEEATSTNTGSSKSLSHNVAVTSNLSGTISTKKSDEKLLDKKLHRAEVTDEICFANTAQFLLLTVESVKALINVIYIFN